MRKFKFTLSLLIIMSIATSCAPETLNTPNIVGKIAEENTDLDNNPSYDANNLESDINNVSISEDNKITQQALDNTNIDYMLSQGNQSSTNLDNNMDLTNISVIKTFNLDQNNKFDINLKYEKYLMPRDYVLITKDKATIYNKPTKEGNVIGEANIYEKVKAMNELTGEYLKEGDTNRWYSIAWTDKNGDNFYGFIPSNVGVLRSFKFDKMYTSIIEFEKELDNSKYGYVSNYKDAKGPPPLMNNKGVDKFGMQAYQSAPLYYDLNNKEKFRYVPDGMMVFITNETKGYYKVRIMEYEGEYWIPKKYVSLENNLDTLSKVVVVDTTNQNQGVFEKIGTKWTLVSYGLATTGVKGKASFVTPIGKFKVLEKRDKFYYLSNTTKDIAGYAPYGIRFAQGAYIHGVPVEYVKRDGKNMDPGQKEFLFTIGTFPRSHKCVRNYTSHAKFLYDWVDVNDSAVIVFK